MLSGLSNPTVFRFASDGRVFVGEKSGLIRVFDSLTDSTPTVFADLRTNVHSFWDRGLLGLELSPDFPTDPSVFVLYTHDAVMGGTAPRWGSPGVSSDPCPTPPGPTADGCVVSGRLSRLEATGNVSTGAETVLIEDWCGQFPSHTVGDLAFGADGALYASGGDGASFNRVDYGQAGSPRNPCGDPPGGVGGAMTAPSAEGGSLRSQDLRTSGDPVGLDGTVIRVDTSGAGRSDNPLAGSTDVNAQRIVAHGLRNPFRFTIRPGTNEVWLGDVGEGEWEEINRIAVPNDDTVDNFGWPCYEGANRKSSWDNADLTICEDLYASNSVTAPFYAYHHNSKVVPAEVCPTGSSSIAGLSFAFGEGGNYPADYRGGLFFTDYSRDCIWHMPNGANGLPDVSKRRTFVAGASNPVDLQVGPGGDLFYADHTGGTIHRVIYTSDNTTPTAVATADPTNGAVPLEVTFDGSGSSDPDPGDTLSYAWDLDGDGAFDDSTSVRPRYTYSTSGAYIARLQATDTEGATGIGSVTITAGNSAPSVSISSPTTALAWKVGDQIAFSGSGTDSEDGELPASALSWSLRMQHCPSNCHTHQLQDFPGLASGSFVAPDHEYPAHLELELTARDSGGLTSSQTVRLDPLTTTLEMRSEPSGLQLDAAGFTGTTPFARTVIVGSKSTITAPSPQTLGGVSREFVSWSDSGAQSHDVTAGTSSSTYAATFRAAATRTVTLNPAADTQVKQATAGTNYGNGTSLWADSQDIAGNASSAVHDYLRFTVPDLAAGETITAARLSLNVTNPTGNGPLIYRTNPTWNEATMTWSTGRPARSSSTAVGNYANMPVGRVSTPVTGITAAGDVSFELAPQSTDGLLVSSSEDNTPSNRPQLILTTTSNGEPDPTAPPAPSVAPASGTYSSAQTVTMTHTDPDATIRYTVGSGTTAPADPTSTSPAYSGAISVRTSSVVKARAFDAAGNASLVVRRDYTVTSSPTTRTVTLNPTADTQVKQATAGANYGNGTSLWADSQDLDGNPSSAVHDYLRFQVPTLAAGETITAARLSVNVTNSTGNGPIIYRTNPTWNESTMTWGTGRPSRSSSTAVGNYASMPVARVSTTVTGINAAGDVSFELAPQSTDGVLVSSSEATSASRPQLILTISS